jgi:hypothetical protein
MFDWSLPQVHKTSLNRARVCRLPKSPRAGSLAKAELGDIAMSSRPVYRPHQMTDWRRTAKRELLALRALSIKQSIAIGEALLTSDVMRFVTPAKGPRPPSLAVALGVAGRRTRDT